MTVTASRSFAVLAAFAAAALLALGVVPGADAKRAHRADADRNHDRIPDRWERANHLSLRVNQANRDQDHDGTSRGELTQHDLERRDPLPLVAGHERDDEASIAEQRAEWRVVLELAIPLCSGAQRLLARAFPGRDQQALHNSLLKALPNLVSGILR